MNIDRQTDGLMDGHTDRSAKTFLALIGYGLVILPDFFAGSIQLPGCIGTYTNRFGQTDTEEKEIIYSSDPVKTDW